MEQSMRLKATHRLLFALSLTALVSVSACDKESTDSKSELEVTEKGLKKEAKDHYDKAKPEDCPTFAKELQTACANIVDKRLNIPCNKYLMELGVAQDQAGGKLFDVGAENAKVGSALCSRGVKRLREDVAKAEEKGSDSVAWADSCKDYLATVRKDCFTKIEKGAHAKHCEQTIMMLQMSVGQKDDGGMACAMGASYFKN